MPKVTNKRATPIHNRRNIYKVLNKNEKKTIMKCTTHMNKTFKLDEREHTKITGYRVQKCAKRVCECCEKLRVKLETRKKDRILPKCFRIRKKSVTRKLNNVESSTTEEVPEKEVNISKDNKKRNCHHKHRSKKYKNGKVIDYSYRLSPISDNSFKASNGEISYENITENSFSSSSEEEEIEILIKKAKERERKLIMSQRKSEKEQIEETVNYDNNLETFNNTEPIFIPEMDDSLHSFESLTTVILNPSFKSGLYSPTQSPISYINDNYINNTIITETINPFIEINNDCSEKFVSLIKKEYQNYYENNDKNNVFKHEDNPAQKSHSPFENKIDDRNKLELSENYKDVLKDEKKIGELCTPDTKGNKLNIVKDEYTKPSVDADDIKEKIKKELDENDNYCTNYIVEYVKEEDTLSNTNDDSNYAYYFYTCNVKQEVDSL